MQAVTKISFCMFHSKYLVTIYNGNSRVGAGVCISNLKITHWAQRKIKYVQIVYLESVRNYACQPVVQIEVIYNKTPSALPSSHVSHY